MAGKEIIEYLFKGNPTDLLQATKKVEGGLKGVGTAGDKASRDVDQSFSRMASGMQSAGQKMQTAGKALTVGVTLPLAYALKQMADSAIEDQAALSKLEGSLKRTTGATRKQLDEVNSYIDKTSIAKAVTDDQLRPAFERLARATGSTTQAQKDLNLAIDVSRATGKDLDAVTQAMAKAYMGNTGALGRLGIATKDAKGETLGLQQIMQNMQQQFGGASGDYMNTAAGRAEATKIKFEELKESIGYSLIPVMEDLTAVLGWTIDKFTALPDWLQKSAIAFALFKGPILWLGGTGIKLIGDYVAKMAAMRVATEAAAISNAKFAGLTTSTAAGLSAAGTALGSNIQLTGGVLGFAGAIDKFAGAAMKLGSTLYVLNEGATFVSQFSEAASKSGLGIQSFVNAIDAYSQSNSWQAFLNIPVMYTKIATSVGLLPKPTQEAGAGLESLGTKLNNFNQVVLGTPGFVDPAKEKIRQLADASGWTTDEVEGLNAALEGFNQELDFIDKGVAAERAVRSLAESIADYKAKQADANATDRERQSAIDGVFDSTERLTKTMVENYTTAVMNGTMTDAQATVKKQELLNKLNETKAAVPQLAGTIDMLTASVNRVPTSRGIQFTLLGVNEAIAGAGRLAEAFRNLTNDARNAQRVAMSTPQAFRSGAAGALGRQAGGTIGFARGGVYPQNSGGGITDGLTYVLGEGRNPREYVIPTDPQYSKRAQSLLTMASSELGVPRQQVSSTFAPTINVSGGSDPQATAAAVADAVEQAFARKKRREGSLAFT